MDCRPLLRSPSAPPLHTRTRQPAHTHQMPSLQQSIVARKAHIRTLSLSLSKALSHLPSLPLPPLGLQEEGKETTCHRFPAASIIKTSRRWFRLGHTRPPHRHQGEARPSSLFPSVPPSLLLSLSLPQSLLPAVPWPAGGMIGALCLPPLILAWRL